MFGQTKHVQGFHKFLLQGLEKVNHEWSLICPGHNLLKLVLYGAGLLGQGFTGRLQEPGRKPRTVGESPLGRVGAVRLILSNPKPI